MPVKTNGKLSLTFSQIRQDRFSKMFKINKKEQYTSNISIPLQGVCYKRKVSVNKYIVTYK